MFKNQLFFDSLGLMLFMLNPFLLIIYLIDLVEELDSRTFNRVLLRAAIISTACYILFAVIGDKIFDTIFNADFASFQIFGGIIFLITGIRYVFEGNKAVKSLRGEASHIQGGIVMPIMVGPGTISASIMIGQSVDTASSLTIIIFSMVTCISTVLILKMIYEKAHKKNEKLVLRYIDILGRVGALLIGTFSIEMIMSGIKSWAEKF